MKTISKKSVKINEDLDPAKEARLALIQTLIPLGLKAVAEELQAEVATLAGRRYSRGGVADRWGTNRGSVYLGDQKVRVNVPRVRRSDTQEEIRLGSYERLQSRGVIEEATLRRVIHGISTGDYARAAQAVPATFGISRSAVSTKWVKASGRQLQKLQERSLSGYDIVAVVLDGKSFGENDVIVALGVTLEGEKVILGFVEASTESYEVCRDFLNTLTRRGLRPEPERLVVIDGGKGLKKAVDVVWGGKAFVQRCVWHKRENIVGYLAKERQGEWRRKLQAAYETPDYETARRRLMALKKELQALNLSAVKSLEEGFDETLTLHRLGLFKELGTSFKTTNMIENVNGLLQRYTGRVTRWRTSDQRQRWVATALLEIEPRLNAVRGHQHLSALRRAMRDARQNQAAEFSKVA